MWGGQYGLGSRAGGYTFIFTLSNGDILSFADLTSAVSSNDSATGTATLKYGTGFFNGTTGSFTYSFACASGCYKGTGTPKFGEFSFTLNGQGSLNLPPTASLFKPSRITPSDNYYSEHYEMTPQGNVVRLRNDAGSGKSGGITNKAIAANTSSMTISLPWESAAYDYTASVTCPGLPTCWIVVPSAAGSNAAFQTNAINATVNPGNLGPGVYPATVTITTTPSGKSGAATATETADFTLIVNPPAPWLALSEAGISFQAVAGGPATSLTKSVSVLTSSTTPLLYQASLSTLSGGNWLTISPSSGWVSTAAQASIALTANPAGLAAGSYFGRVDFTAAGAVETPQSLEIQLTVAPNDNPIVTPSTAGLIFVAPQSTNPAKQSIALSTLSTTQLVVTAGAEDGQLGHWFSASASTTDLTAAQPITQTITVDTTNLTPGVYAGVLHEFESPTKKDFPVRVVLVVTPASGACTPTKLIPVSTSLSTGFQVTAGQPVSLQAQVVDDCGSLVSTGSLVADISSGDAGVVLAPLGQGRWSGSWQPRLTSPQATVSWNAAFSSLQGLSSTIGAVVANPSATMIYAGGLVSAASLKAGAPVAPGAFLTIVGTNLATATATATSNPLPTTLGGTRVLFGGQPMAVQFVSPGQINAIVPYETPINEMQQLLVQTNGVYSYPEDVAVAATSPAVFTQTGSGKGLGAIIVTKVDGTQFIASPSSPAGAGDVLSIYCSGLGAVSPAVNDGAVASVTTLSNTVSPVTVTIGGVPAQVFFAGLAPGSAGLYQVNVAVPAGVTPNANVPVVLTSGGAVSPPVTIAVQ